MYPTRSKCLELMREHKMLEHIIDHSLEVARVALFLSAELNRKGQHLDLPLVEVSSLLHDLAKTECFQTKQDHARVGFELLRKMGYDRIAQVIAQHIRVWNPSNTVTVSEEEVVNYADKRVLHDRIVSVKERLLDLKDRYGRSGDALRQLDALGEVTLEIENKIFSILEMNPDELGRFAQAPGDRGTVSAERKE